MNEFYSFYKYQHVIFDLNIVEYYGKRTIIHQE